MTVCLANISPGTVRTKFMQSVLAAYHDPFVESVILHEAGPYLDDERNRAVRKFLYDTESEWLLFVDSDIVFTLADVKTLVPDAPTRDVICGVYMNTYAPPAPTLFKHDLMPEHDLLGYIPIPWDEYTNMPVDEDGYITVDAAGTGFMLIHRDLITEMLEVWFEPKTPFAEMVIDGVALGEDITFCARVRHMGYRILVNPAVKVGHIKAMNIIPPPEEPR